MSVAFLAMIGCGESRIDGSDPERARITMAETRQSVPDARKREFDSGVELLMRHAAERPTLNDPRVRHELDGKTGLEIIAAADRLRHEELVRKHDEQVQQQIAEINGSLSRIQTKDEAGVKARRRPRRDPNLWYVWHADDDVADYCEDTFVTDKNKQQACEQEQMRYKEDLVGKLPKVPPGDAMQLAFDQCKARYPGNYKEQWTCDSQAWESRRTQTTTR